jgi:hypothetical protein
VPRFSWKIVRVLLDESVPRQLGSRLVGHEVLTVPRAGWAGLRNGELLRRAASEFDVFVTGDQGLEYQQNLVSLEIAIVVVVARDNRVATYLDLAERILIAVDSATIGSITRVIAD